MVYIDFYIRRVSVKNLIRHHTNLKIRCSNLIWDIIKNSIRT